MKFCIAGGDCGAPPLSLHRLVRLVLVNSAAMTHYGSLMPAKFGSPGSLVRFHPPKEPLGPFVEVQIDFAAWEQGDAPTCTAAAALGALAGYYALSGARLGESSLAYTYLGAEKVISTDPDAVEVEDQIRAGVPLAATMESVRRFGVVPPTELGTEAARDPVALTELLKSKGQTLEDLRKQSASLMHPPPRAVRLFPTAENIENALRGGLLVTFSFRVDTDINAWMGSRELQTGSAFVLPSPTLSAQRIATHACLITAYDSHATLFTVRNSFGPEWGRAGNFYVSSHTMFSSSFSGSDFFAFM